MPSLLSMFAAEVENVTRRGINHVSILIYADKCTFFCIPSHCGALEACMEKQGAAEAQCVTDPFEVVTSRLDHCNKPLLHHILI